MSRKEFNERERALQISEELEEAILDCNVTAQEIADYLGVTKGAFSRNRIFLRNGRLPTSRFVEGFRAFFEELEKENLEY